MVKGAKAQHTVLHLKRLIATKLSFAVSRQRLVFAGEELKDEKTLEEYNIQKDAIIHVVLTQRKRKAPQTQRITTTQPQTLSRFEIFVQVPGDCAETRRVITGILPTDPITRLKECTSKITGCPPSDQRLLFGGKELDNCKTLADYSIENGVTIQMGIKIRGG